MYRLNQAFPSEGYDSLASWQKLVVSCYVAVFLALFDLFGLANLDIGLDYAAVIADAPSQKKKSRTKIQSDCIANIINANTRYQSTTSRGC